MTAPDDTESRMLRAGWTRNFMGWWHPPACVAAWPPGEAREMFRESEKRAKNKEGETIWGTP